jgi:hypothetical protein
VDITNLRGTAAEGPPPFTTFTLPRRLGKNDPGISVILFFYKTWT